MDLTDYNYVFDRACFKSNYLVFIPNIPNDLFLDRYYIQLASILRVFPELGKTASQLRKTKRYELAVKQYELMHDRKVEQMLTDGRESQKWFVLTDFFLYYLKGIMETGKYPTMDYKKYLGFVNWFVQNIEECSPPKRDLRNCIECNSKLNPALHKMYKATINHVGCTMQLGTGPFNTIHYLCSAYCEMSYNKKVTAYFDEGIRYVP
jgi:hypothetical protein